MNKVKTELKIVGGVIGELFQSFTIETCRLVHNVVNIGKETSSTVTKPIRDILIKRKSHMENDLDVSEIPNIEIPDMASRLMMDGDNRISRMKEIKVPDLNIPEDYKKKN